MFGEMLIGNQLFPDSEVSVLHRFTCRFLSVARPGTDLLSMTVRLLNSSRGSRVDGRLDQISIMSLEVLLGQCQELDCTLLPTEIWTLNPWQRSLQLRREVYR